MSKNQYEYVTQLSPKDKKTLGNFVQEVSNCMLRQAAERDLIKDICTRAKDELEIDPSDVRKMGRIHYKNSLVEDQLKSEQLYGLYEQVFSVTGGSVKASPSPDVDDDDEVDEYA